MTEEISLSEGSDSFTRVVDPPLSNEQMTDLKELRGELASVISDFCEENMGVMSVDDCVEQLKGEMGAPVKTHQTDYGMTIDHPEGIMGEFSR